MAQLTPDTSTPPSDLLWGSWGQGKTAFFETGGAACQLWDLDSGAKTGLYLEDKWQERRKQVDWKPFLDKPGQVNAFSDLKAYLISVPGLINAKKFVGHTGVPIRAVAIDSLTSLGEAAMRMVLNNNQNLWGNPTQPQWGMAMTEVKQVLAIFRSLPIAKVLIAHEEMEDVGGTITLHPKAIGKKLYPDIPPLFDEIHYAKRVQLQGDAAEFRIHTKTTSYYNARSRYNLNNFNMDLGFEEYMKRMYWELYPQESKEVVASPMK